MKKKALIGVLLACVATGAYAQPSSSPAAPTPPGAPATSTISSAPITDPKAFVQTAANANLFEIETSKLALTQGSNKSLKQFARKMVTDHTKTGKELQSLVSSGRVTGVSRVPNALDPEHQRAVDELKGLKGQEFDQRYYQLQVDAHQQAVDLFQTESQSGEDKNLKAWAKKTLPHLMDHLERIKAVKISA
jgi:putative membrane protein